MIGRPVDDLRAAELLEKHDPFRIRERQRPIPPRVGGLVRVVKPTSAHCGEVLRVVSVAPLVLAYSDGRRARLRNIHSVEVVKSSRLFVQHGPYRGRIGCPHGKRYAVPWLCRPSIGGYSIGWALRPGGVVCCAEDDQAWHDSQESALEACAWINATPS